MSRNSAGPEHAGIGKENVNLPKVIEGCHHGSLHGRRIGHVQRQGETLTTDGSDLTCDVSRGLAVHIGDDDTGAACGHLSRKAAADATAAAGNQSDLTR